MAARARIAVFVAGTLLGGCALALGLEDHDFVEPTDAGVEAPPPPGDDAGPDVAADDCGAPSCEGRCDNLVASCGSVTLGAECGSCVGGLVCNLVSKQCECPSPCGKSTCGDFANACDGSTSCGTCDAGDSCQERDAGSGVFACKAGPCISPTPAEACDGGRCSVITDRCGHTIDCGACSGEICVGGTCACPPRDVTLDRHVTGAGQHCVATPGAPCSSPFEKTIGHVYSGGGPSTNLNANLYRCALATGGFFLSTQGNCEGQVVSKTVQIGKCMVSATPVCGAVPLRRLKNNTLDDFLETTDPNENPSGYVYKLNVCWVWPP